MYRRCLHCRADLGSNHALPVTVGQQMAFDSAKGRLWVICPHCARWNLTPLEERWEAIDEAERLYRRTPKRVATDNIGMAQVSDALQLVRIGEPLRPEFAAWRYGAEFLRRRVRSYIDAVVGSAVSIGLAAALASTGLTALAFGPVGAVRQSGERRRGGTPVRLPDGSIVRVFSFCAGASWLRREEDGSVSLQLRAWRPRGDRPVRRRLGLPGSYELVTAPRLSGDAMVGALRTVLPFANQDGASKRRVHEAVQQLEAQPEFSAMVHGSIPMTGGNWSTPDRALVQVDLTTRLALEMALHEADERAAFADDLTALEARWREAEEIAAIADDLLLPEDIRERVERGRGTPGDAVG